MEFSEKPFFPRKPRKHRQLNAELRKRLAVALGQGLRQNEIAGLLNVHPSTIGRELKRNSPMGFYDPKLAQLLYRMRKLATAMADRCLYQNRLRHHALSVLPAPRTWILWLSDTKSYNRELPFRRPRYIQTEKRKHRLPYRKVMGGWRIRGRKNEIAWPPSRRAYSLYERNDKPYHYLKDRILFALMRWDLNRVEAERKPKPPPLHISVPNHAVIFIKPLALINSEEVPLLPKAA
ncbi:helix-turn-helix domain-containing protein [Fulvitalea axinellae]